MIVLILTKNQREKEKNLPKTLGRKGGDTQHPIVMVIPQILNQIQTQIQNPIHCILIQVLLVMGNTKRGREISVVTGRRELDGSRGGKAGPVEVKNQNTSPEGLIIVSFSMDIFQLDTSLNKSLLGLCFN